MSIHEKIQAEVADQDSKEQVENREAILNRIKELKDDRAHLISLMTFLQDRQGDASNEVYKKKAAREQVQEAYEKNEQFLKEKGVEDPVELLHRPEYQNEEEVKRYKEASGELRKDVKKFVDVKKQILEVMPDLNFSGSLKNEEDTNWNESITAIEKKLTEYQNQLKEECAKLPVKEGRLTFAESLFYNHDNKTFFPNGENYLSRQYVGKNGEYWDGRDRMFSLEQLKDEFAVEQNSESLPQIPFDIEQLERAYRAGFDLIYQPTYIETETFREPGIGNFGGKQYIEGNYKNLSTLASILHKANWRDVGRTTDAENIKMAREEARKAYIKGARAVLGEYESVIDAEKGEAPKEFGDWRLVRAKSSIEGESYVEELGKCLDLAKEILDIKETKDLPSPLKEAAEKFEQYQTGENKESKEAIALLEPLAKLVTETHAEDLYRRFVSDLDIKYRGNYGNSRFIARFEEGHVDSILNDESIGWYGRHQLLKPTEAKARIGYTTETRPVRVIPTIKLKEPVIG